MSRISSETTVLLFLAAVMTSSSQAEPRKAAPLFDDLGHRHYEVTTTSPEAQRYFDQGLTLCFAFNHPEAIRSFEAALEHDPKCAMAYWGIAFAVGPNINAGMMEDAAKRAYDAAQKGLELASTASSKERELLEAMANRYAADPDAERAPLDLAWADAMREVSKNHPEDLDIATIFAESLMDTMPWDYWNPDGTPKPATTEVIEVLERVLAADPDHPGANHYYIHAVEASPDPGRGLEAARRLGSLVPGSGHLVHMPSHIFLRLGHYRDAVGANVKAAKADEKYAASCGLQGFYPMTYYSHNVHFLWYAQTMLGQCAAATDSAAKTVHVIEEGDAHAVPLIQWMNAVPTMNAVRFGQWTLIIETPKPPAELAFQTAMWHFGRGMAHIRRGQIPKAQQHADMLRQLVTDPEIEKIKLPPFPASAVVDVAATLLEAELAGRQGKLQQWINQLTAAVEKEDALPYMEPPYWYFPVRPYLGAAFLETGKLKKAETTFLEELEKHPRNGWALFGLLETARRQGRTDRAMEVESEFREAWSQSDVILTSPRF